MASLDIDIHNGYPNTNNPAFGCVYKELTEPRFNSLLLDITEGDGREFRFTVADYVQDYYLQHTGWFNTTDQYYARACLCNDDPRCMIVYKMKFVCTMLPRIREVVFDEEPEIKLTF